MVDLAAFFEEDFTLGNFSCDGSQECPDNPTDLEFKCPGYLEADVVNMARDMIARDYKQSQEDKTADNNDQSK
jgi:hypothetical protein